MLSYLIKCNSQTDDEGRQVYFFGFGRGFVLEDQSDHRYVKGVLLGFILMACLAIMTMSMVMSYLPMSVSLMGGLAYGLCAGVALDSMARFVLRLRLTRSDLKRKCEGTYWQRFQKHSSLVPQWLSIGSLMVFLLVLSGAVYLSFFVENSGLSLADKISFIGFFALMLGLNLASLMAARAYRRQQRAHLS